MFAAFGRAAAERAAGRAGRPMPAPAEAAQ
jgi:hypothetical protein